MKTVPVIWDDATIEEAASGRLEIYNEDKKLPYKLSPKDREAYERAKKVGFITQSRRVNAECCYAAFCKVHGRPLVRIRRKIKYATVHCDMIVCDWKLDAAALRKIDKLRGALGTWDRLHADDLVEFVLLDQVPLDEAETIAFRLFECAMDCRPLID